MGRIFKNIASMDQWFNCAPPKMGKKQWEDGRSAKELARAWFPYDGQEQVPEELRALLDSDPVTRGIGIEKGEPEFNVKFDDCGGEVRNADLVLWGNVRSDKVVISIEAKADEPFGPISGKHVDDSLSRNPRSRIGERFSMLCRRLFGNENNQARELRYQLLTATAGALAAARDYDAKTAVLIIHEFAGKTDENKLKRNEDDLNQFLSAISKGEISAIQEGMIVGPIHVPDCELNPGNIPLYIGKCTRKILKEEKVI